MSKVIKTVSGICGCGKTQATLKELVNNQSNDEKLVIFASLTCQLSKQSLEDYKAFAFSLGLNAEQIDSTTNNSNTSVSDTLRQLVIDGFKGVLFVTHATLLNETLRPILQLADIIIDEIPASSVTPLFLHQSDNNVDQMRKYCEFNVCKHNPTYSVVSIKDSDITDHNGMVISAEEAANIQIEDYDNGDRTHSKEFINVLRFLVRGLSVLYYQSKNHKHVFQALDFSLLDNLVGNAKSVTILAANINESLVGTVAASLMNINIESHIAIAGLELKQKHNHKIKIIPFLTKGNWSESMKNDYATKKPVMARGKLKDYVLTEPTVLEVFQGFVLQHLSSDFLYFPNIGDAPLANAEQLESKNIIKLTTACHGINNYRDFKKVAFTAALNPTPDHLKLLDLVNTTSGLMPQTLSNALITDRYLEAAYQCVARSGIRNHVVSNDVYTVVVPDMRAAQYIAEHFEDGCVEIDSKSGFEVLRTSSEAAQTKMQSSVELRLAIVKNILMDKKNKVAAMPELFAKHGITKPTFDRYKREFKSELQSLGLIKVGK